MIPNPSAVDSDTEYVGRFAPSPTGPLHFGSLIAAVASYLDARANSGRWLVRMEDLDPPREPPGAADQILSQLQQLGFRWDGEVLYQSARLETYGKVLQQLQDQGHCYCCDCTRSQIRAMGSIYNGSCRHRSTPLQGEYAIRLKTESATITIDDLVQGRYQQNIGEETGDFVIFRKDKLFAYQLAVVIDDEFQGISHIIRGFDLIDSAPRQIYLQRLLHYSTPAYGHVPIIIDEQGKKLSKQHFAAPIDVENAEQLIHQSLMFLGQAPPDSNKHTDSGSQLQWGIENWDIQAIPKLATISQDLLE